MRLGFVSRDMAFATFMPKFIRLLQYPGAETKTRSQHLKGMNVHKFTGNLAGMAAKTSGELSRSRVCRYYDDTMWLCFFSGQEQPRGYKQDFGA